ncbi:hypothetical protein OPV22_004026 [Ensete ventricosum]|uniref:Uncharacterized protein n=1 Tax=Ensete ventricosum TaxID=4639 RepID=A0AAV8S2L6_ENSVE|nr:hypothetical protein OPV22_004026 [Ensete ventricosum]
MLRLQSQSHVKFGDYIIWESSRGRSTTATEALPLGPHCHSPQRKTTYTCRGLVLCGAVVASLPSHYNITTSFFSLSRSPCYP